MTTLLLAAPCWALWLATVALAWPIWQSAREAALFERRVVLAEVMRGDSRLKRWLWSGRIASVLHGVAALGWSAMLVAFAALLTPLQWLVLAIDVVALAVAAPWLRRRLAGEVREQHVATVARRWPLLWANVAIVSLAFFAIDFFAGAPDTRGIPWAVIAERVFERHAGQASCAVAGLLIGTADVVEALGWHAAQVLVPTLPGVAARVAAWTVVLLHAGVVAWVFSRLILGVSVLVGRVREPPAHPADTDKPFAIAVLLLALPLVYVYATTGSRGDFPDPLRKAVAWSNPCRTQAGAAELRPALKGEVEEARREALAASAVGVDAAVGRAFAGADALVDNYLDWYFSVVGEYQRLGTAIATGDFAKRMRDELERRVVDELRLDESLGRASSSIAEATSARFAAAAGALGRTLETSLDVRPCLAEAIRWPEVPTLERDALRASSAAAGGVVVALGARWLAQRAAGVAVARLATRGSMQTAAGIAGRVAARRGGTLTLAASAAAACAPGGPLAGLCALVAGAVSWLALDHALVRIDEMRFRDAMRADLMEALRAAELRVAEDLKLRHRQAIDEVAVALGEAVDRVFVPARDGL